MEIPRKLLDQLTEELNAFSAAGRQMVLNALANVEWNDVAELRTAMVEVMEMVCGEMTDLTAARSAEFYDGVRQMSVGSRLGALAESGRKAAATEGAVRALVQSVVETGSTERFARKLGDRVDYEVKKAASDCVEFNALRDPVKPKWARVPSGAETCSFCIMLASRGFAYHSQKSAEGKYHGHAGCDCRIVPGFNGMDVEGYDTAELYQKYLDDVEGQTVRCKTGGGKPKKRKWDSTEFESYGDFTRYVKEADSIEELQRRCEIASSEWSKTTLSKDKWGELRRTVMVKRAQLDDQGFGAIYEKPRASLEDHEKKGVDWLVKNGIRPTVKQEDPRAMANIDFEIHGQPWEMKNVTNAGSSVNNQIARARAKWRKLELDEPVRIVVTMDGCSDSIDDVVEAIKRREGYSEVVVLQDGKIARVKK